MANQGIKRLIDSCVSEGLEPRPIRLGPVWIYLSPATTSGDNFCGLFKARAVWLGEPGEAPSCIRSLLGRGSIITSKELSNIYDSLVALTNSRPEKTSAAKLAIQKVEEVLKGRHSRFIVVTSQCDDGIDLYVAGDERGSISNDLRASLFLMNVDVKRVSLEELRLIEKKLENSIYFETVVNTESVSRESAKAEPKQPVAAA